MVQEDEKEKATTIAKYFAVIIDGDEYHKVGEEHGIAAYALEEVKEHGIKIEVSKDRWRTYYHYYPVRIIKKEYSLNLIGTDTIEGGNRDKYRKWGETIGLDYTDNESYDWKDHWC